MGHSFVTRELSKAQRAIVLGIEKPIDMANLPEKKATYGDGMEIRVVRLISNDQKKHRKGEPLWGGVLSAPGWENQRLPRKPEKQITTITKRTTVFRRGKNRKSN